MISSTAYLPRIGTIQSKAVLRSADFDPLGSRRSGIAARSFTDLRLGKAQCAMGIPTLWGLPTTSRTATHGTDEVILEKACGDWLDETGPVNG